MILDFVWSGECIGFTTSVGQTRGGDEEDRSPMTIFQGLRADNHKLFF